MPYIVVAETRDGGGHLMWVSEVRGTHSEEHARKLIATAGITSPTDYCPLPVVPQDSSYVLYRCEKIDL